MTTPIVLKAADVTAAARKAYDEKRLSAQGPTPACKYRDASGRPCAIGAAIPDDAYRAGMEGVPAEYLGAPLLLESAAVASRLQNAHDDWALSMAEERLRCARKRQENAFRALIGLDPLPVEG